MTASTGQERELFEAFASDNGKWLKAIERDAHGNYRLLTTNVGWMWWQAARQGPVVPQGWKLVPVEPTQEVLDAIDLMADDHRAFDDSDSFWRHLVAAAPQPPEPAQLDDINAADMHQVFDLKGEE